jgi:hypothetical protein
MKKLLYILLLLPFASFAQGGFGGDGALHPLGAYPIAVSSEVKGAPQSVATWQLRNAILPGIRTIGQFCKVTGVDSLYILSGGIANSNWIPFTTGLTYTGTQGVIVAGTVIKTGIKTIVLTADSLTGGITTYSNGTLSGYSFTIFDNAVNRYLSGLEAVKNATGFVLQHTLIRGDSLILQTSPLPIAATFIADYTYLDHDGYAELQSSDILTYSHLTVNTQADIPLDLHAMTANNYPVLRVAVGQSIKNYYYDSGNALFNNDTIPGSNARHFTLRGYDYYTFYIPQNFDTNSLSRVIFQHL